MSGVDWLFPWLGRLYTSNLNKASSWPLVLFGVHEGIHVRAEVSMPQVVYNTRLGPTVLVWANSKIHHYTELLSRRPASLTDPGDPKRSLLSKK